MSGAGRSKRLGQMVELANRALFNVHGSIEHLPGATQARLEIVRTTLEYLDRLNTESGSDARVLSTLASAYARVARVQGSPLQPNLGDLRGAEASYVKAGTILDSLMERGADNADLRLRDAELREEYGTLLAETGLSGTTRLRSTGAVSIRLGRYSRAIRIISGPERRIPVFMWAWVS